MPEKLQQLPPAAEQTVRQRIEVFQRREFDLAEQIRSFFRDALGISFRQDLERFFLQHFILFVNREGQPTWNLPEAQRLDAVATIADAFDDEAADVEEELEIAVEEELIDSYEDGYLLGLWELDALGIDVDDADPPPDRSRIRDLLLAGAIGGLAFPARAEGWRTEYGGRFRQLLRAAVAGERTLGDTLAGVDATVTGLASRIEALGQNEQYRAFTAGTTAAREPFTAVIHEEVWVTRGDVLVCPICREMDLTVTTEQPPKHPACRCTKVPLVDGATFRGVSYEDFLDRMAAPRSW